MESPARTDRRMDMPLSTNASIQKKIFRTLLLVAVFKLGCHIPLPFINIDALLKLFHKSEFNNIFQILSAGALEKMAIFSLGIIPIIIAQTIIKFTQLSNSRFKAFLDKDKKNYRKTVWFDTFLVSFLMSFILTYCSQKNGFMKWGLFELGINTTLLIVSTLFILWLSEKIDAVGIGNGIGILLMVGILKDTGANLVHIVTSAHINQVSIFQLFILFFSLFFLILIILRFLKGTRKVPIGYAKRIQGGRLFGGQSTYLPLSVDIAGIEPLVRTLSIMSFFFIVITLFKGGGFCRNFMTFSFLYGSHILFNLLFLLLLIFYIHFFMSLYFDPYQVSDNLKKHGGFIPGIRAGNDTAWYLNLLRKRLLLPNFLFLSFIAGFGFLLKIISGIHDLQFSGISIFIITAILADMIDKINFERLKNKLMQQGRPGPDPGST